MQNTHLFTPDRNQSMDTTEVLLGEPTSFIGVSYWSMGEELQEQK